MLGHIELPVRDPLASLAYYVDTWGFELVANQGDRFIWVKKGSIELLLRPGSPFPGPSHKDSINFVLYSDDVVRDVAAATARGVSFTKRANCHHFRDPDGYWWQLVDPGADHSGGA